MARGTQEAPGGRRRPKGLTFVVKRPGARSRPQPRAPKSLQPAKAGRPVPWLGALALSIGAVLVVALVQFNAAYTVSFQLPFQLRFQWPLVVAHRTQTADAAEAQSDQHRSLTAYQQYACTKFGPACRVALAIQRAENPAGQCEIYHHNNDGTLDWGYFQINTVHLQRKGLNLRDLLDCKANIDFAYRLYEEKKGFTPWSTFNNGAYRRFLRE